MEEETSVLDVIAGQQSVKVQHYFAPDDAKEWGALIGTLAAVAAVSFIVNWGLGKILK